LGEYPILLAGFLISLVVGGVYAYRLVSGRPVSIDHFADRYLLLLGKRLGTGFKKASILPSSIRSSWGMDICHCRFSVNRYGKWEIRRPIRDFDAIRARID
jgi:hypothetical protein